MENKNEKERREVREALKAKISLESHINTIYLLNAVPEEFKQSLMKMLSEVDTITDAAEVFDYIIDLYHVIRDGRVVIDSKNDIQLAKTLIAGISDTLYQNGGQVTLDMLDKAAQLIHPLEVNKKCLKDEIVLNIKTVRERFKKEKILAQESLRVLNVMLNQLALNEN